MFTCLLIKSFAEFHQIFGFRVTDFKIMPTEKHIEAAGRQTCDVGSVLAPFMTTYWVFVLENFLESLRLVAISVRRVIQNTGQT